MPLISHSLGVLVVLPAEVIQHIIFLVDEDTPLGPPSSLKHLLITSRALSAATCDPALHARIFRRKFDSGAAERRGIQLTADGLKSQLAISCRVLKQIRRGVPTREQLGRLWEWRKRAGETGDDDGEIDMWAMENTLLFAHQLMLDNDGKNYAQLEWAGIHNYLLDFFMHHSWQGHEQNNGWPTENMATSCVFWLMWHTYDHKRLIAESTEQRNRILIRIFPFALLPHIYPASLAPPNHHKLPLPGDFTPHKYHLPGSTTSSFYPDSQRSTHLGGQTYPHYLPDRSLTIPYFGSYINITPPLASLAAKLLFVSRREIKPFSAPPHLPRNREEAIRRWWADFLRTQAAVANADAPLPIPDPPPPIPDDIEIPTNLLTQEHFAVLNRGKAAVLPRGVSWDWESGCAKTVDGGVVTTMESKLWDTTWERMRWCGDYRLPRPEGAPGAMFERGSMRGMWKGIIYIPQGNLLAQHIHQNPAYPGLPNGQNSYFTEASLGIIAQPCFLQFEEHTRACGHEKPCGVIPVPPPVPLDWRGVPFDGVLPQDLPAGHPHHPGVDFDPAALNYDPMDSSADRNLAWPPLEQSMSNAWLPGPIGGLSFVSRPAQGPTPPGVERREQIVISLSRRSETSLLTEDPCVELAVDGTSAKTPPVGQYVYETYDPAKVSAHDVIYEPASYKGPSSTWVSGHTAHLAADGFNPKCVMCVKRETARKAKSAREERETRKAFERRMRGVDMLEKFMEEINKPSQARDEQTKIEKMDVKDFGFTADDDDEDIDEDSQDEESDDEESSGDHSYDGCPTHSTTSGHTTTPSPTRSGSRHSTLRPVHGRSRATSIPPSCANAADTLFTGETPACGLAWSQKFTTYGRLRPWDGLIGLVRVGRNPINFMFFFGYIHGRTFVGEWRVAASDPFRPAWSGAIVMGRMDEEEA